MTLILKAGGSVVAAWMARGGRVGVLLLLLSLGFASAALAGPPTHLRKAALDFDGFNHACGVATDSTGDVYVSNAGESTVEIFDSGRQKIASIGDVNEPCGLAVDSQGILFVSETLTGEIVRYVPDAYPLSATPTYGSAEPVVGGGNNQGISVDPFDDSLYVTKGDRVDAYANESQQIQINATGGTYTLSFEGRTTPPLPFSASHTDVQSALEALSSVGTGNVSVTAGGFQPTNHLVTFIGSLGLVNASRINVDSSGLTGSVSQSESQGGFAGSVGAGTLTDASGVAAYTYRASSVKVERYVFVADTADDDVKVFAGQGAASLKLRRTITGPMEGETFGFGAAGAYIAVDSGNRKSEEDKCAPVAEQACTAGHVLVYDESNNKIDEFDASGEFLDQFTDPELADGQPTALAVDRSDGATDGTIYVTVDSGPGAKLLAFDPLPRPSRRPLSKLSHVLATARAVAIDPHGDVYVATGSVVRVFNRSGQEIKVGPDGQGFPVSEGPAIELAVDSSCHVYVLIHRNSGERESEKVQYYTPDSCSPHNGTQYSGPVPVLTANEFVNPGQPLQAIGLNPSNDHLFAMNLGGQIVELGTAAEGSPVIDDCFACGLAGTATDIAVYGSNGSVYMSGGGDGTVTVLNAEGTERLRGITGVGSPQGSFGGSPGSLDVDQSNGHVLIFNNNRGAVEEYDASGAFVGEFSFPEPQKFTTGIVRDSGIAVDNSDGPSSGNVYVAFDDTKADTFDLWAFGPLTYGDTPSMETGIASAVGGGNATLNGKLNPEGFDVEECGFEYIADDQYALHGFTGAASTPCAESMAAIGRGSIPVDVHADVSGLDPDARYRFRLVSANRYGAGDPGNAWLFGPPILKNGSELALPILYDEATLGAEIDSSGLATKYHFEYGTSTAYGQSTPSVELIPGDGGIPITASLTGLAENTEYHFRVVFENEAKTGLVGPDVAFETLTRSEGPTTCPNTEYRTGLSANLPDCRAYELVTPAETNGASPVAAESQTAGEEFNNWLVSPRGEGAGESVAYFIPGTLPGFEGTGSFDGYRARRASGSHPSGGWASEIFGPSFAEADGNRPEKHGMAPEQDYWFWQIHNFENYEGGIPAGNYLRSASVVNSKCTGSSSSHYQLIGCGSLGTDPTAQGRFLSAGGAHVIFSSKARLQSDAAPVGTEAIYDRAAGAESAEVLSVKEGGSPFGAGKNAAYLGTAEDGSAVAFSVGTTLYLHRAGSTVLVAEGFGSFAGLSVDGSRLFYTKADELHFFDAIADTDTSIAPGVAATFVSVSPDGSHLLFTSEKALTGGEENEMGQVAVENQHNLYALAGGATAFVGILDPEDLVRFAGRVEVNLGRWTTAISAGINVGRAYSPTRSTPNGDVFAFQSHAQLTAYDNKGHGEIYRYAPTAALGERVLCVSCDPSNAAPSADATFQEVRLPIFATTLIPNITEDGRKVIFQSQDRLLPEDANAVQDVYEWKAPGAPGCQSVNGCLGLISSGQGEGNSSLYGMTEDGHDVFLHTLQKLVGADVAGSPSIYDAREGGGIPEPLQAAPCQGDSCQGAGSTPPAVPSPSSDNASGGGNVSAKPKPRCPKSKRKVQRAGKTRCVRRHGKKHHHPQANSNRRPER